MAKLLRLQISGIRNFSPNEDDVANIKFSSPLTLILGQNGCGKTTIIESLKFACTGDVPGGSAKGQGFIHDPKINSTVTCKGQVRLRISDAKGNEITILKSAQVRQERDKIKFETLDSTLDMKKPNGEKTQLSSRCADIGNQFCQMLGVSKPILNYVIFCHQEDALWPLDEGKALKEKFDKIFDVDSYNKCIDIIRKIVKEKTTNLKILKVQVGVNRDKKDSVERSRAKLAEKEAQHKKYCDKITELDEKMGPVQDRINEICTLENNFGQLENEITAQVGERKSIVEQQKTILRNIEVEFEGNDVALATEISTFERKREENTIKIDDFEENKQHIDKSKADLAIVINRKQVRVGELKELQKQNQNRAKERNDMIKDCSTNLGIHTQVNMESDEDAAAIIKKLTETLARAEETLKTMVKACSDEEKNLQENIDKCRERKAQTEQGIKSKEQQCADIRKQSLHIKDQLQDLDIHEGDLKNFKIKIQSIEKDLESLEKNFDPTVLQSNIEKEKQKITSLEITLAERERELEILQNNSTVEYDIDNKRTDIRKRESEIKKLQNKHHDNLNFLFGNVPESGLKTLVEAKKKEANNQINSYTLLINKTQSEVTKLETELKMQKNELASLQSKLEINNNKMFEVCKGKPYERLSAELHNEIETLQRDKGQYSSAKIMYEKFIKDFQKERPCCPVCETGFSNKREAVNQIVKTIREKIQGIPGQLRKVEEELIKKQELHSRVLQLGTINEELLDLQNKRIPEATENVSNKTKALDAAKTSLSSHQNKIATPQKTFEACNILTADAIVIDQNQLEVRKAQGNIENLECQIIKVASNISRVQAKAQIEELKSDLSTARLTKDQHQQRLTQNNERRQNLREQKSKLVEKQLQLQKTMQGKPQLEEQLEALQKQTETLQTQIEELQMELAVYQAELKEAEDNKGMIREANRATIESHRKDYNANQKLIEDIRKIQGKMEAYARQGIDDQFNKAIEELTGHKSKEDELNRSKESLEKNIHELKIQLEQYKVLYKQLGDNVTLRKLRKEEQEINKALLELQARKGNFNYESLNREKQKLQEKWLSLQREVNTMKGQRDELSTAIRDEKAELEKPANKNAYMEYKHKLYEQTVCAQSIVDLKLYNDALDASIMEFHSDRMKQVNKIIREYWRSIYRGNDIDYIEIKNEKPPSSTGVRRTFNYRVVQLKNGVELDMRGRCSAGQKVLACLIIRMALAETFSHECGILALDEPTTNLDRDNIISLSEALARVVNTRQAERNFQLLVITHDEDFISTLMHVEKVPYYYKVSRNEKGTSTITRETL